MGKHSVSVIIPTIGRQSLRDAVKSVLSQENCLMQAIVVLDAPERIEQVTRILRGLPHELYFSHGKGASVARNLGLDHATGDYIGYLDDDDRWLPGKAEKQIAALSRAGVPEVAFSVAGSCFVREDGLTETKLPKPFDPARESLANYLVARKHVRYGAVYFNTPAMLGPASVMKQARWDDHLRKHEDWDVLIRLAKNTENRCIVVPEILSIVRQGSPGSISKLSDWRVGFQWLEKHNLEISGRSRADYVLLHILMHALRNASCDGIRQTLRLIGFNVPHAAAVIRFIAGLLLGR